MSFVSIQNEDGSQKEYELLASRMERFLVEFPPKEFPVIIETKEYLSIRPGVLKLYESVLASGKKPEDAGLPPLGSGIVFTASLFDSNGNKLLTASSLKLISHYKDWEIGETAARQRLVAAAGYDGASLSRDETSDMADQKIETKPEKVQDASDAKGKATRRGKRGGAKAKPAVVNISDAKADDSVVPPAMIAQIEQLAKMKGVEAPKPKTLEEAKAALKKLLA